MACARLTGLLFSLSLADLVLGGKETTQTARGRADTRLLGQLVQGQASHGMECVGARNGSESWNGFCL